MGNNPTLCRLNRFLDTLDFCLRNYRETDCRSGTGFAKTFRWKAAPAIIVSLTCFRTYDLNR
jgi:hypothetical protein